MAMTGETGEVRRKKRDTWNQGEACALSRTVRRRERPKHRAI